MGDKPKRIRKKKETSDEPAKIGRPSKINAAQLKAFMRFHPSLEDTAAFFGVCIQTIEKHVRNKYGIPFAQFREKNTVKSRYDLKRKCLEKALKGDNTMLIWTTKNMCGWADKVEKKTDVTQSKPFQLAYDPKTMAAINNEVFLDDEESK